MIISRLFFKKKFFITHCAMNIAATAQSKALALLARSPLRA